ncbi:MAG: DUF488 domain-containing protein [Clostridia bacterium]|nr:DUF488 domain-containing protein [Clostridia bacterium]
MNNTVYTIGYEGRDIDEFISILMKNEIEQLLDVREIPVSRKVGFSKSKLCSALENAGISYIHMKELGSPKEIRDSLHQTHDYEAFFKAYQYYIGTHFSYVQTAWEHIIKKKTCIMCFERKPSECHRSALAQYIKTSMPLIDEVINL